jgi:hypothetical protein
MSNLFVFKPGAPPLPGQNVFNNWLTLINAMSQVEGRKILEFDDSIESPCRIPPQGNPYPMKDVVWAGLGPRVDRPVGLPPVSVIRSMVEIQEGATFSDLRMIGGQITIVNTATSTSPVSDFGPTDLSTGHTNHLQIGLRDDCGNTQIVNYGSAPMFDLGGNTAFFFVQNCLFGMPIPGDLRSVNPLIRQTGASKLTINLMGQNQTGENVVRSEAGATVMFGILSDAAQVAAKQDLGNITFAPTARIQRQVVPLAPLPPVSTQAQSDGLTLTKPTFLIRCDGRIGFTQVLPKIRGGFTVGNSSIPLYTGGQEVVVAEVVGGLNLTVGPSVGDTIDGYTGLVYIGAHGSRTFLSDGYSNWITTSIVFRSPGPKPPFHTDF